MNCMHRRPRGWKKAPTPTFRCTRCWKVVKVPEAVLQKIAAVPKKKSMVSGYFYWSLRKDRTL